MWTATRGSSQDAQLCVLSSALPRVQLLNLCMVRAASQLCSPRLSACPAACWVIQTLVPLHLLQGCVAFANPHFCSCQSSGQSVLLSIHHISCACSFCTLIAPVHASLHLLPPPPPLPHAMLEGCTYGFSTLETHEKGGQVTPSSNFAHSACSFYDFDAPIYTMSRFLPPSKVADAEISDSILGDGTVIRAGCNIKHSVIGLRTLINENCTVEDALVSHAVETCC